MPPLELESAPEVTTTNDPWKAAQELMDEIARLNAYLENPVRVELGYMPGSPISQSDAKNIFTHGAKLLRNKLAEKLAAMLADLK